MKYQLSVEQVRIRIKLKNTTNFVRRLASLWLAAALLFGTRIDFMAITINRFRRSND
jgi:hypothetical protein